MEGVLSPNSLPLVTKRSLQCRKWVISNYLLDKGILMESPKIQAIAKTLYYSPQIDSKTPLQKTTPTQFIEHREVELVPSLVYSSVFGTEDTTRHATEREACKPTQPQNL